MVYLFFGICIIAATFCLGFRSLNKNFWGLVAKYIASLSFLIIGITAFAKNPACNMNYFVPLFTASSMPASWPSSASTTTPWS